MTAKAIVDAVVVALRGLIPVLNEVLLRPSCYQTLHVKEKTLHRRNSQLVQSPLRWVSSMHKTTTPSKLKDDPYLFENGVSL